MSSVIEQVKQNRDQVVPGTGVFSRQRLNEFVDSAVNDRELQITRPNSIKGDKPTMNPSEHIREGLKKTVLGAGCPSKTELSVLDTAKINTKGVSDIMLALQGQYLSKGNPIEIPLADGLRIKLKVRAVPAGEKVSTVRDMKTQEVMGTSTTTFKDHHQVSLKNIVPDKYKTKVFRDNNGKVVKK